MINTMETKFGYCNQTGLLYVDGVPFTKESIQKVKTVTAFNKENKEQFEYGIIIQDNINDAVVVIDQNVLNEIEAYIAVNNLNLAEDEDFK